jgi:hypothetical protein
LDWRQKVLSLDKSKVQVNVTLFRSPCVVPCHICQTQALVRHEIHVVSHAAFVQHTQIGDQSSIVQDLGDLASGVQSAVRKSQPSMAKVRPDSNLVRVCHIPGHFHHE